MKKTIVIFILGVLIVTGLALWALKGRFTGDAMELLTGGIVFVLVGFAAYLGASRLRSHLRREPGQDEMSRKVMVKASSLAYYVSIYLWLFVMYISDKTSLPGHSLIGAGILGMAVVFLFCWLGVKAFGFKNE